MDVDEAGKLAATMLIQAQILTDSLPVPERARVMYMVYKISQLGFQKTGVRGILGPEFIAEAEAWILDMGLQWDLHQQVAGEEE